MITRVPCQIILVVCAASCSSDGALRLNQIQLKGTHNSYHRRPGLVLVSEHDYEHQPLDVQLEQLGVRVFELDIHQRSDGFLVYHLPVVDSRSTCRRLRDCLETVKRWSDSHTGHVPLFIWIEPKDDVDLLRRVDDFEALDAEILAVWPRQRLITPDLVRGERESLRAAIELDGWPRLDAVRGRAMFILLDTGKHRDAYLRGRRDAGALDGRVLFVKTAPDELDLPFAAVVKIDDPTRPSVDIALRRGCIVASNVGRAGLTDDENRRRLETALRRGVHLLKGDFPAPVPGRTYWFEMPGGRVWRRRPAAASRGIPEGSGR